MRWQTWKLLSIAEWTDRDSALSSPMKLTSSANFSPSIRISLRLKIHQAQAKNFCRVLDIRVPEAVERNGGKLLRRRLICVITGDRVLKRRVWGRVAHLSPVFLNEQPFPALPIVPQHKTVFKPFPPQRLNALCQEVRNGHSTAGGFGFFGDLLSRHDADRL